MVVMVVFAGMEMSAMAVHFKVPDIVLSGNVILELRFQLNSIETDAIY